MAPWPGIFYETFLVPPAMGREEYERKTAGKTLISYDALPRDRQGNGAVLLLKNRVAAEEKETAGAK